MARHIFQIETGEMGLAIVNRSAVGYVDTWQAPAGKTLATVTIADYHANADDWSCQVVGGALNATPSTDSTDVPPTWCSPGETIPTPGLTTYEFSGSFLQDIDVVDGLNQFLFEFDTAEAYVYASFAGGDAPKFIGRTRLAAGTMGGEARTNLVSDFTLPLVRKPDVEFGNTTASDIVTGAGSEEAIARLDAKPGDTFDADPDITASDATNASELTAEGFVANPQTAWTTGQRILVGSYSFFWDGDSWTHGTAT